MENSKPLDLTSQGLEQTIPIYKGFYPKLYRFHFDPNAVHHSTQSKIDWNNSAIASLSPSQCDLLLRLEALLRLRNHWLTLWSWEEEAWKTILLKSRIFETYCKCRREGLAQLATELLKAWDEADETGKPLNLSF